MSGIAVDDLLDVWSAKLQGAKARLQTPFAWATVTRSAAAFLDGLLGPVESLATADAVLVIDETGVLKQGKASCGVGQQYTGSAGKITNCQIGVFAAQVSAKGHAFVDRRLYLPKHGQIIWSGWRALMCRTG